MSPLKDRTKIIQNIYEQLESLIKACGKYFKTALRRRSIFFFFFFLSNRLIVFFLIFLRPVIHAAGESSVFWGGAEKKKNTHGRGFFFSPLERLNCSDARAALFLLERITVKPAAVMSRFRRGEFQSKRGALWVTAGEEESIARKTLMKSQMNEWSTVFKEACNVLGTCILVKVELCQRTLFVSTSE